VNKQIVLVLSPSIPYDMVPHAGGKTHNYYLKKLNEDFELFLVTCGIEKERERSDLDKYGIKHSVLYLRMNTISRGCRLIFNLESKFNPYNRYSGLLANTSVLYYMKSIKKLRQNGFYPDIVLCEWTETAVLIGFIKKVFPDAKIVVDEVDVTFQRYQRRAQFETNRIRKKLAELRYKRLKEMELSLLDCSDLVLVQNEKDVSLLAREKIPVQKIQMIAPYFMNFTNVKYQPEGKNILFFGAMNRPENYLSAIWFIENVIPLISDRQMRFVIAGGNPHPKLHAYASERVQVLGYVEDMAPLFSKALCFCAPLILGAGIKVKVIEAMSAGLPTLTNSIGIEGIPAKNGIDYIHCETADDYAKNIEMLMDHKFDILSLSCNSKALIQNHFNIESSYLSLQRRFAQLIDNKPISGSF